MDPLSIAASAASLAGTAGTISIWLYELINEIKNVDTKLSDLSKEVAQLSKLLQSVENMVQECQSQALTLAHLDDNMWQQIDSTLLDCKINIEGLDRLVMRLRGQHDPDAKNLAKLMRKSSMHFHFTVHKDEIADYTSKLYKSNCAMQTTLAVVNVSLIFRTNVTQESLFLELQNLKELVQESLKAARRPEVAMDPFSARQSKNLESLARAAQKFHYTASSTASTYYGDHRSSVASNWGGSEIGVLTDVKRDEIEKWNALSMVEESTEGSVTDGTLLSVSRETSTTLTTPDKEDMPDVSAKTAGSASEEETDDNDDGDESDVELDFLRNLEELAHASFMSRNYTKAEQCLRLAVERSTGDVSGNTDFKLLQIQLALCCCLQEKWDHAVGILSKLPKTRLRVNLAIFHLWQAISLAHLVGSRFDDAYNTCKIVLQGKKKILGRSSPDYQECLYVFATICESRGNSLEAEAVRHSIPRGWSPGNPESVMSPTYYLLQHPSLAGLVFQKKYADNKEEAYVVANEVPMSPQSCESPETFTGSARRASDEWTSLGPGNARDGVQRAEHDERKGTFVEETDTGKEFFGQNIPAIVFEQASESIQLPIRFGMGAQADQAPQMWRTPSPFDSSSHSSPYLLHESSGHTAVDILSLGSPKYAEQHQEFSFAPTNPSRPPQRPISPKKHKASHSADMAGLGNSSSDMFENPVPSISRSRSQDLRPSQPLTWVDDASLSRSYTQDHRLHPRREAGAQRSEPNLHHGHLAAEPRDVVPKYSNLETLTPSNVDRDFSAFRPRAYQSLIDKVREAKAKSAVGQGGNMSAKQGNDDAPLLVRDFIEFTPGKVGEEWYSTLEVTGTHNVYDEPPDAALSVIPVTTTSQAETINRLNCSVEPASSDMSRRRWTVQKDLGNIGGPRPFSRFGSAQFLALRRQASNSSLFHVGVSVRMEASDSIAVDSGPGEVTICYMPASQLFEKPDSLLTIPSLKTPRSQHTSIRSSALGVKSSFRKVGSSYFSRAESALLETSTYTVNLPSPRNWPDELDDAYMMRDYMHLFIDKRELQQQYSNSTRQIEQQVANLIKSTQLDRFASLRLEGIVYALPDFLERALWTFFTMILADCDLMQHAKVIPHSVAVVQYYLDRGALTLDDPSSDASTTVVVLNCDEVLVDCVAYNLQAVSEDYAEISGPPAPPYVAEFAGSRHAQAEFARLVNRQLRLTLRQLVRKLDSAATEEIIKSCCDHFQQRILPDFENDGQDWTVEFQMPHGSPIFQHGQLTFSNSEVLACFLPSVRMARKILDSTVTRLHAVDYEVSSVLLAGSYSRSKYLVTELQEAVANMGPRNGRPIGLIRASESDDICSLGALSHAMGN